jgi:GT2 family glycosyltransferase
MLERLKSENIAAVQPKILSYLEPAKFEHAGASGGFLDRNGFPFCRGRIFSDCEVDQGQYDKAVPVFWASGACLMVKSEVFHQMDGFDPFFFAHMEEIDLCWRMQHAGHQIWVEPKSKVYHLGGGTLGYESPRKTYLNFRNNLFMLVKNQGGFWPGRLFVRMAWDGIAAWQFLLKGRASLFYQVFKAHMALYYALPRLLKQRRNSVSSSIHGRPNINLIVQFFLLKKKTFQELP